jgi:septal ring-binding cell division protein DamX
MRPNLCGLILVWLACWGLPTTAEERSPPIDKILLKLQAADYSPYAVDDICNDDDDDVLPENTIEEMYANGRMAFLFGQYKVAYKAWNPLAELGYAKAEAALAWMYYTGNGVNRDTNQAIKWYKKAAQQGNAIAQNNLGVMYENGQTGRIDEQTASSWYQDSADEGYAYAQYNLGRMYAEGRGVKQDLHEARYWWRIASRQGVKQATEALDFLEKKPSKKVPTVATKQSLAHAPHHSNPVAKGLAWLKEQPVNHYTIQLARRKDSSWILKLAASHSLPQPLIQFQSTDKKGQVWHNLIYGSFTSFQAAEQTRRQLPDTLRKWSPWLRRFGEVHQDLKK